MFEQQIALAIGNALLDSIKKTEEIRLLTEELEKLRSENTKEE